MLKASQRRIHGFDFARAVAIFGMTIINFKCIFADDATEPAWLYSLIQQIEGRAAAGFVILAGIGVTLFFRSTTRNFDLPLIRTRRKVLLKRAIFLFASGSCFFLVWPPDILHFYGLYLIVAVLMSTLSDRRLILWAAVFILMFILLTFIFSYESGWNGNDSNYADLRSIPGILRNTFFNGYYPVFPWTAFLLMGMWLGRQDLDNKIFRYNLFLLSAGTAGLLQIVTTLPFSKITADTILSLRLELTRNNFWTDFGPFPPSLLYMFSAGGTAFAVIIICLEVAEKFSTKKWLAGVLPLGRLSFSYYIAHIIIGAKIPELIFFDDHETLLFPFIWAVIFFASSIPSAYFWEKRFSRGPMEWLMRRFSDSTGIFKKFRRDAVSL